MEENLSKEEEWSTDFHLAHRIGDKKESPKKIEKPWSLGRRVYLFSTAALTNYYNLVAKTIQLYYLMVLKVRSLKWVL